MLQDSYYNNINSLKNLLIHDESLLRLLYYPPRFSKIKEKDTNHFDSTSHLFEKNTPLSNEHPNLIPSSNNTDSEKYYKILQESFYLGRKKDDIQETPLCRLYIYNSSSREKVNTANLFRTDIVNIDILVHSLYDEGDSRKDLIMDRIDFLLRNKYVFGTHKNKLKRFLDLEAPNQYSKSRIMVEGNNLLLHA